MNDEEFERIRQQSEELRQEFERRYPPPPDMSKDLLQSFIEKEPLYKKLKAKLPKHSLEMSLEVIFLKCHTCLAERPFHDKISRHSFITSIGPTVVSTGIRRYEFLCTGCNTERFECWVEINKESDWVRKVGQAPPWSIDIPSELEKELGDDAKLYKKALALMSQSYGMGACAYLRRMIENQINPILKIIYEIEKINGVSEENLQKITDAINSKNFTPKIEMAYALLPPSIIVDGENPVKLIHDQLSIGIHSLDEDQAMEVAMKIKSAFEYVVIELNRQQKSKKKFIEEIRSIPKAKRPIDSA
jgi:hypothetical protein